MLYTTSRAALSPIKSSKKWSTRTSTLCILFTNSIRTYFHHRYTHSDPHLHTPPLSPSSSEQAHPRSQQQLLDIMHQVNYVAEHNQKLLREFEQLKRQLEEKETKSLCSWIDTNPFKFGVLCGTIVFMMVVTRLELKKNKMKVSQLREKLNELAQQKKLAAFNGRGN
ncbi:hypothetical protein C9374_013399 [Naegleria lovaniensis]|uniref:Uncharacterized protein n=1 Tax=Naegleria lovaniensis TaxID=51637 RepID=A0AA88KQM0_NAELO|nr:uncharacterized protein C9374_013399 [Naegleria lovaniensis]KAG2391914.1 hypothetical protein C9374_013399 [Naegleria lovaniensis]